MKPERKRPLVAHLIDRLPPDGAERLLADVLHNRSSDWDFVVVCLVEGGPLQKEIEQLGIPVVVLGCRSTWDIRVLPRLGQWLRQQQPDVIHTHLFMADTWGRLLGRIAGVSGIMTTVHSTNDWKKIHHHWVDRILSHTNDAIFACTEAVRDQLSVQLGSHIKDKLVTVENGVNVNRVVELSRQNRPESDPDDLLIAIVGRLHEAKGHDILFRAMKLMHADGVKPVLYVIGDGPERVSLENLAAELDLEEAIRFLGFQSNPFAWLSGVSAVAMPSRWEGLPMALLEVMALGLPVVASDAGGMGNVIEDGVNGYTIAIGDDNALAKRMTTLLTDKELRTSMGEHAQQTVNERYNVRRVVESYERAYALADGTRVD